MQYFKGYDAQFRIFCHFFVFFVLKTFETLLYSLFQSFLNAFMTKWGNQIKILRQILFSSFLFFDMYTIVLGLIAEEIRIIATSEMSKICIFQTCISVSIDRQIRKYEFTEIESICRIQIENLGWKIIKSRLEEIVVSEYPIHYLYWKIQGIIATCRTIKFIFHVSISNIDWS